VKPNIGKFIIALSLHDPLFSERESRQRK